MKKLPVILVASAIALCCVAYLALSPDSIAVVPTNNTPVSPAYSLGEHDGRLAVFFGDSPQPLAVYDVFIDDLPELDAKLLKKGITVHTQAELFRLVEDYTG